MNSNKKTIALLLETIDMIVNDDQRPYKEKIKTILAECNERDRTNLSEFTTWFDEIDTKCSLCGLSDCIHPNDMNYHHEEN